MSTAQNMGALSPPPQIKTSAVGSSFTNTRHVIGLWRHAGVRYVLYKMSGKNTSTGVRECWSALDPRQGPPSGASMTNVLIDGLVKDGLPSGD